MPKKHSEITGMSLGVQSGHTRLSGGVRGKTRATLAREAARITGSNNDRMSVQNPVQTVDTLKTFGYVPGEINNKFDSPYFNPQVLGPNWTIPQKTAP